MKPEETSTVVKDLLARSKDPGFVITFTEKGKKKKVIVNSNLHILYVRLAFLLLKADNCKLTISPYF